MFSDCAKAHGVPIRIGVNSGSVEKCFLDSFKDKCVALTESLLAKVRFCEKNGFENLVLSLKSSDTSETISANRRLASLCDYPLHIGVTEAGVGQTGIVKNSIGIGRVAFGRNRGYRTCFPDGKSRGRGVCRK